VHKDLLISAAVSLFAQCLMHKAIRILRQSCTVSHLFVLWYISIAATSYAIYSYECGRPENNDFIIWVKLTYTKN
jgi:hypothetical protein